MELLLNMLLAFIEGLALIVSPCILPLLPLILGGSLSGGKGRPLGIILGFVIAFTLATLFSRSIILWAGVNPNVLRDIALLLLLVIGIVMVSNYLSDRVERLLSKFTARIKPTKPQGGFGNGLLFGALLGVLWTPCAGPLLAAVIVQSIAQKTTFYSSLVTLAFGVGVAIPMLLIVLFGRKLIGKFNLMSRHSTTIRRILGIVIIIGAIGLYFQNWFTLLAANIKQPTFLSAESGAITPYQAPAIEGISAWINSPPLELSQLRGKVVLIDFWTYSCINCIRTFPYLKQWYKKYHDQGLVIIGIHSPEFAFEGNVDNVIDAVKYYDLTYPVALDNQFKTWQNYRNNYWPSHYLIDKEGRVVYQHFGEGNYLETENQIRKQLGLPELKTSAEQTSLTFNQTPEIYLGFSRAQTFANTEVPKVKQVFNYRYPTSLPLNSWALQGNWQIENDRIVSANKGASLKLHFIAKNVYAVMGASNSSVKINVLLDGKKVTTNNGKDVIDGISQVSKNRLYHLLQFEKSNEGVLELDTEDPGLQLYTFTFG